MPFSEYLKDSNINLFFEILEKLEKSREHAAEGMYREATEISRDMRTKYGL